VLFVNGKLRNIAVISTISKCFSKISTAKIQLEPKNRSVVMGHQNDVKDTQKESPRQRANGQLRNDCMKTAAMQVITKAT
jgi:hypothetical protein